MAIAFSRSIRSLKMDSFRFSVFGLALAAVLLVAWMAWFFLARISLYEMSKDAKLGEDGSISVKFPAERMEMIQAGQTANIQIEGKTPQNGNSPESPTGTNGRAITAHAMVMKVQKAAEGEKEGQVDLMLIDEFYAQELLLAASDTSPAKLMVQIEVERVAPFALIQRAARQYFAASPATQADQRRIEE
jgi:hypothetical protein